MEEIALSLSSSISLPEGVKTSGSKRSTFAIGAIVFSGCTLVNWARFFRRRKYNAEEPAHTEITEHYIYIYIYIYMLPVQLHCDNYSIVELLTWSWTQWLRIRSYTEWARSSRILRRGQSRVQGSWLGIEVINPVFINYLNTHSSKIEAEDSIKHQRIKIEIFERKTQVTTITKPNNGQLHRKHQLPCFWYAYMSMPVEHDRNW